MHQIGLILSLGLSGATMWMFLTPVVQECIGRGHLLQVFTMLMAISSFLLPSCATIESASLAVFVGCLSLQPNVAPQMPLEHAIIADTVRPEDRTSW